MLEEIKQLPNKDLLDLYKKYVQIHHYDPFKTPDLIQSLYDNNISTDDIKEIILDRLNGEKKYKPTVDIYLDEEYDRFDTEIEFYLDPNHTFSISIDPSGNIDWAYLWGEYSDCGHGIQFVREGNK